MLLRIDGIKKSSYNNFFYKILSYFLLLLVSFYSVTLFAVAPLNIGVLAFRPKTQTIEQWQPIANYLSQQLNRPVTIAGYNYPELNQAVELHQVDMVLTNPVHYIQLRHLHGLSAPLATMVNKDNGVNLDCFGGVVFTRADNSEINQLADLKNKMIAMIDVESLGGYQMQAYALKNIGIDLDPKQLVRMGMPHDLTVAAVLSGQVSAGFLRTGVLEGMASENKLDIRNIKVINRQDNSQFPFLLSTPLYPEWPIAVMPHLDANIVKMLAVAMLSLPIDGIEAQAAGIHSFIAPADYSSVENLLRGLRLAPFGKAPIIKLADLWHQYWQWVLLSLLFLIMLFALFLQNRNVIRMQRQLLEHEVQFKALFDKNNLVMILIDPDTGKILDANKSALAFYGYDLDEMKQLNVFQVNILTESQMKQEMKLAVNEERNYFHFKNRIASGEVRDVEVYATPILVHDRTIVFTVIHDVTIRKQLEQKQKMASDVFNHAREGIMITDAQSTIVDVNRAFTYITGYGRSEVIGKNARILQSGLQSKFFYEQLYKMLSEREYWSGEIWNRRKNGEIYAEMLTISAVKNDQGQIQNYIALFIDITQNKNHEQELNRIAHFDSLTDLPNRLLLIERLHQQLDYADAHQESFMVIYIDLDGFKAVNDAHGHHVGDELLIIVSTRMKKVLRDYDTFARIGGDEFIAVIGHLHSPEEQKGLLGRLLQAAAETVHVQGINLHVSASIGVTLYPQDKSNADLLMRHADQTMYEAKQLGKNRYCFWQDISA